MTVAVACALFVYVKGKQKNACFVWAYLHATVHGIKVGKKEEEADCKLEGQEDRKHVWGNKSIGGPGKGRF